MLNAIPGLWIPGLRQEAHPGMTTVEAVQRPNLKISSSLSGLLMEAA
jgi:hypothetical protein